MPTIFVNTDNDRLTYDLAPGADIQSVLPLLVEDIGETEDVLQLYLNGNRIYPGMPLINGQTYELVIASVERILLRAKQRGEEWYVEQMPFDSDEPLELTRHGKGRYQIRHSEELRYVYDEPSFVAIMKEKGYHHPIPLEVEQFMMDHIQFLPGDYIMSNLKK